ncbi:alpha/beta fold hydrolase [Streptomyces sp. cmx-4-9]|uniref:alpha/beta fold hydrolase n=1 Tax=Streptomyces sp. cmx-4-9 TaxID=2790941 RepID=UPI00397FE524
MTQLTTPDGTTLSYQDWGQGRPVILTATAMLDSRMWEFQASFLAEQGLRCITYDRRGSGRSDKPWDGYDYDTLADDLACLLDHLDVRDAVLVGYALGGGEAVRYLHRHGTDRVAKLALVASTTPFMQLAPDNPQGLPPALLEEVTAAIRRDRAGWLAGFTIPFFGGPEASPEELGISRDLADWLLRTSLDMSPRAATELYRTLFQTDQRAEVAALDLPVLIIHGTADIGAPYDLCARPTAALLPKATFLTYQDAAHALFATRADQLSQDLLSFARDEPTG